MESGRFLVTLPLMMGEHGIGKGGAGTHEEWGLALARVGLAPARGPAPRE